MLDRKIAPEIKQISSVNLIQAEKQNLANGLPLYSINAGSQDLVKIKWMFDAGSKFEKQKLTAQAANSLLKEGTSKLKSAEIAELLDYYGAFLETECNKDKAHLTLYSLNKHLPHVLPVMEDILKNAVFPEHEFEIYKQNSKQKLLVNNQKVDVLARNHFNEIVFGKAHPYGSIAEAAHYDSLNLQEVREFYKKYYVASNCKIMVAGLIKDESKNLINSYFGKDWTEGSIEFPELISTAKIQQRQNLIEKKDAVQSAIRMGRILFNKTHPDYFGMQVLNTLLGGYFGSRLMNNIREDKGYTYGIGSAIASLQHSGYFFIATEVGVDVCAAAIKEIYHEIKIIKEELVSEEELDLVKNYMLGTFVRSIDGPFALSEKFESILDYNLTYEFYENYLTTIRNITPQQIQKLAQTYLQEEDLVELVVGLK